MSRYSHPLSDKKRRYRTDTPLPPVPEGEPLTVYSDADRAGDVDTKPVECALHTFLSQVSQ